MAGRLPPGAPVGPDRGHLKGQRRPRPEQRERAGPPGSALPRAPGAGPALRGRNRGPLPAVYRNPGTALPAPEAFPAPLR